MGKLLTIDGNTKIRKSDNSDYEVKTAILHLAPGRLSGKEVCPSRSLMCSAACLNTAGRGMFDSIQTARINKTKKFFADRRGFVIQLAKEITSFKKSNDKRGVDTAIRLNGTSDLSWENIRLLDGKNLMEVFPNVIFYDYTKIERRAVKFANGERPSNYHLTFSATEDNEIACTKVLGNGGVVAMVFAKGEVPKSYKGFEVVDGDKHDLRYMDAPGVIVGLSAKGTAKHDLFSGFVRQRQLFFSFMSEKSLWFHPIYGLHKVVRKVTRNDLFKMIKKFWGYTSRNNKQLNFGF